MEDSEASNVEQIRVIDKGTLIPIGSLVVLAAVIIWLTANHAQVEANSRAIQKLETKQDMYNETVSAIDKRLSRIEGKLEIKGGND